MPDTNTHTLESTALIGGIGLTEVHVYAQHRAPDGQFSGCPHIHAVTDEAYFILEGHGSVEFHDLTHGLRRMNLEPGQYVHFPPLVLHRLISGGNLIVLGIMGNAGLAERGEARIYFGPDVDDNPERYRELCQLPLQKGLSGALERRDAAVSGYQKLIQLWHQDRNAYFAELNRFAELHCAEMKQHAETFLELVHKGPAASTAATRSRIHQLPAMFETAPDIFYQTRGGESAFGMCGILRPIKTLKRFSPPAASPHSADQPSAD